MEKTEKEKKAFLKELKAELKKIEAEYGTKWGER